MPPAPAYLDHAATTPVRPEVREAMLPFLGEEAFGNPSSAHQWGRKARAALEGARRDIAAALGAPPASVYFTSGGTEADNLAILGAALAAQGAGQPMGAAVAATEHKAVLAAAHEVGRLGGRECILPVSADGCVEPAALDGALTQRPSVLSAMWVNNETGVAQPVEEIAVRCRAAGVLFHTDAVQALGKVPVHLDRLPGALATISGHKIGAPKGIGALVVPERERLAPLIHGGGQQRGLRPGTENVAGAVGLARAVTLAVSELVAESDRLARLRDGLETSLRAALPDAVVHGGGARRAPHILSIAIPGTDSEAMLMHLDLAGIAASSGSACTTGAVEPSHVLTAMGVSRELATATIRLSLGWRSTTGDVEQAAAVVPEVADKVRRLSQVLGRARA
jgi:cysteine desulfurase